jgi:hypothetical protein
MTDHPDFSVVVKNRGRLPTPWKWEIYRSGRMSPVKQSDVYFSTVTEANRAGRETLNLFLSEFQNEAPAQTAPKIRSDPTWPETSTSSDLSGVPVGVPHVRSGR